MKDLPTICPFCKGDDLSIHGDFAHDRLVKIVCIDCEASALADNEAWIEWASPKTLRRAAAAQLDADRDPDD